jgi:hypothetical protein
MPISAAEYTAKMNERQNNFCKEIVETLTAKLAALRRDPNADPREIERVAAQLEKWLK